MTATETMPEHLENNFWQRVDMTGECWIWQGPTDPDGYGRASLYSPLGRACSGLAHRMAWALVNDFVPRGLCVCHSCDNPACVRPSHLFVGTVGDNHLDKKNKGRANNGIRPKTYTRRWPRVPVEIKNKAIQLYHQGWSQVRIGKELGIAQTSVSNILKGVKQ